MADWTASYCDKNPGVIPRLQQAAPGTQIAICARTAMNATLPQIMRGGKNELQVMDDMMVMFGDDAPEFAATYKAARNIVDAGKRHDKEDDKPQEFPGS